MKRLMPHPTIPDIPKNLYGAQVQGVGNQHLTSVGLQARPVKRDHHKIWMCSEPVVTRLPSLEVKKTRQKSLLAEQRLGWERWCPPVTGVLLLTSRVLLSLGTKGSLILYLLYWLKRTLTPTVSAGVKLSSSLLLAQSLQQKSILSRNASSFVLIVPIHLLPSRQPQDQQAPKRWAVSTSCNNRQQLTLEKLERL